MTDPLDETQPHAPDVPATPGSAASDPTSGIATGTAAPAPSAPASAGTAPAHASAGPATAHEPSLRVNPDRPADSGWREPAWVPPRDRDRDRDRRPGAFSIVVGLAFIAIGAWYFLDRTLGLALPRIQWNSLWPIALIVLGGLILIRSLQRRA